MSFSGNEMVLKNGNRIHRPTPFKITFKPFFGTTKISIKNDRKVVFNGDKR